MLPQWLLQGGLCAQQFYIAKENSRDYSCLHSADRILRPYFKPTFGFVFRLWIKRGSHQKHSVCQHLHILLDCVSTLACSRQLHVVSEVAGEVGPAGRQ